MESILFWIFTCCQRGRSGRAGISYRAYKPLKRTVGDGDGMSDWSERSDSTLVGMNVTHSRFHSLPHSLLTLLVTDRVPFKRIATTVRMMTAVVRTSEGVADTPTETLAKIRSSETGRVACWATGSNGHLISPLLIHSITYTAKNTLSLKLYLNIRSNNW